MAKKLEGREIGAAKKWEGREIGTFKTCLAYVLNLLLVFVLQSTNLHAQELWVYAQTNLLVPSEVERIEQLLQRSKNAGYTHLLVADSKFSRLSQLDKRYFNHVEKVKHLASQLQIKLVPAVCSVGYSNDILSLNPNLAEALPVQEAIFTVQGDLAEIQPDPRVTLPALSDRRGWGFIDESLKLQADHLESLPPHSQNVRVSKKVLLSPYNHYHVSVQVKTKDFDTPVEIKVLSNDGRNLTYTNLGSQPTQDWTEHHVTFNSLNYSEATLYIGSWGPKRGSLSIKDPVLEVCGAVNMVRRSSAPISIKIGNSDGTWTPLSEGSDFENWSDPKLGCVPYAGEYQVWHEAPPIKLLKKLPDGSKLKVSYFHTHIVYDGQVCGAASDTEFQNLLDEQIERMSKLFPEADFMMSHDEYRVMGWTPARIEGLGKDATPAQVISHNVRYCTEQLHKRASPSSIAVWSDMFDPYHNAVERYYLVNGSLTGSVAPSSVRIVNWNFDKRSDSLKHFANRGHSQILAGYYDAPPDQIAQWLDTVVELKIPRVQGVMYTTWRRDYSNLEAFAKLVKSHIWYTQ